MHQLACASQARRLRDERGLVAPDGRPGPPAADASASPWPRPPRGASRTRGCRKLGLWNLKIGRLLRPREGTAVPRIASRNPAPGKVAGGAPGGGTHRRPGPRTAPVPSGSTLSGTHEFPPLGRRVSRIRGAASGPRPPRAQGPPGPALASRAEAWPSRGPPSRGEGAARSPRPRPANPQASLGPGPRGRAAGVMPAHESQ